MVVPRFFFSSRRRHTRLTCDWSSDVCSSDLGTLGLAVTVPVTIDGTDPVTGKPGVELTGAPGAGFGLRSEERRVGKECRTRWSLYQYTQSKQSIHFVCRGSP